MKRKEFIRSLALIGLAPAAFYCTPKNQQQPPILTGPDSETGHQLRDPQPHIASGLKSYETLIVGAGISGLTAAYTLSKQGIHDYLLIELEKETGGNSSYHTNAVSSYPLGAHYLPIPNTNQPAMLAFLQDAGIITGYNDQQKPLYRDEYLCHEPEERLFIKNNWQEGLVPDYSVPDADKKQIAAFLQRMQSYRTAVGEDGKEAFNIPVMDSSRDETFLALDGFSFNHFLKQNGWDSEYLHWYVDYCLRDDFGTRYDETSAWMGVHYFASRKGVSANADANDVLTWPEGNGKLAMSLLKNITGTVLRQQIALHIEKQNEGYHVMLYDAKANTYTTVECKQLVLAVPQFICHKLLPDGVRHPIGKKLTCAPWLVANLTVKPFDQTPRGVPLSWDNVIYGSTGLGYVNACHQHLQTVHEKYVLTYYKPLLDQPPAQMRQTIRKYTKDDWQKQILEDLQVAHPNLNEYITDTELFVTGHSMPQPTPGTMRQVLEQDVSDPKDGLYFCHSDRAGYSIFEEAFYWGHRAAEQIIQKRKQA